MPVPFHKAASIVLAGFVCGFCTVAAFLTYSEDRLSTTRLLEFVAGAVLALIGAFAVNRLM